MLRHIIPISAFLLLVPPLAGCDKPDPAHHTSLSEDAMPLTASAQPVLLAPPTTMVGAPGEREILIPAGSFIRGSNKVDEEGLQERYGFVTPLFVNEHPEHTLTLPAFILDKYEVTNARYMMFVAATNHRLPDHWVKNGNEIPKGKEAFPIIFVSWQDAVDYCEWNGKRLPTEFEWEKGARGTDGRVFPWGNEFDKNKGNTPQYGLGKPMKVGSFENGKSPYGLYDMAGNIFEWTSSWYKAYPGNTHKDPNEGEMYRVVKGGSWYDCTYYRCGISAPAYNRIFFHPRTKNFNFGFRCAKNP